MMKRRVWLIGGGAAAAAAAGMGWRAHLESQAGARFDAATGGIWRMRFERPAGGEVVMAGLRGRPLLLNFWATWCPPCLREMPALDRFQKRFAADGWQVLGLAVDRLQPVRDFLARNPVGYAIGMAGFEGTDLSRRLGNDSGALPFTAIFGRDGLVRWRKLGETDDAELAERAALR